MGVRVSLTDRVSIEANGAKLDEQSFPGRQGRLVFAYLLEAEGPPVPRDELDVASAREAAGRAEAAMRARRSGMQKS